MDGARGLHNLRSRWRRSGLLHRDSWRRNCRSWLRGHCLVPSGCGRGHGRRSSFYLHSRRRRLCLRPESSWLGRLRGRCLHKVRRRLRRAIRLPD